MQVSNGVHPLREAETHRLIAGDPALDFANTLNGHGRPGGHEYLHDFRDLALWCRHAGVLSPRETRRVLGHAAAHPGEAQDLYRRSLALRESLFRLFRSLAVSGAPQPGDMNPLNAAWRESQRHAKVTRSPGGFALAWDDSPLLERIPRAISSAAVQTLMSGKAAHIKACAGEGCDWLFIDSSRNHLRRWCSMEECGNRAKMRRRQQRKKPAVAIKSRHSARRRKTVA